jgi:tetratricopeptide (TPR) repeat protein
MHDTHSRSLFSIVNEIVVYSLAVVVPLLFLPFIENTFDSAKHLWIVGAFIVTAITWSIHLFKTKEFAIKGHTFLVPQLLFILSIGLSSVFSPLRLSEDFSSTLGAFFILTIWGILATTLIRKINTSVFLETVLAIGIVLALVSILQVLGIGPTLILNKIFGLQFPEKFQFSPTGSPLIALTFMIPVFIGVVVDIISTRKWNEKVFEMVGSLILLVAIIMHLFLMFPGKPDSPVILPFSANWVIAVENLKTWNLMFLGFGPNSFVDAFTLNRPVGMNATLFWNVLFQTGTNTPLTYLVSLGLLGVFAWLLTLIQSVRTMFATHREHWGIAALVMTTFVTQLLFPPNIVLATLQTVGIVVWVVSLGMRQHHSVKEMVLQFASLKLKNHSNQELSLSPFIASFVSLLTLLFVGFVTFMFGKNIIAEYFYVETVRAVSANDGQSAYSNIQRTLRFNPERDAYHRTYAQTNFALANSISSKEDITDEDRKNVAQLMQQSIREARVAAGLNPQRSINWKIMAEIYRSLIGSVEKADQFTVAAYAQAIQLYPTEPTLRVDLGGVFLGAKNYEQAAQLFEQAARLKPDYANAYYNWAKALEGTNRWEPAVAAYKQTLRLLEANTETSKPEQIEQVKKELSAAEEQLAKLQSQKPATNTNQPKANAPQPTTTPAASSSATIIPETETTPEAVEPPTNVSSRGREDLLNTEPDVENQASDSANQ